MRVLQSILLSGGAGFVGSALARQLLRCDGFERLVVLDKLTGGGCRENLADVAGDPRFTFVEGDIADQPRVERLIREAGLQGVMNLAAERQVGPFLLEGDQFTAANVAGTVNLLEACRLTGIPMLQCSTAEVYGPMEPPGQATEESPLAPATLYAASKAAADLMCLAFRKSHGQDVVITRGTYLYGPRQHPAEFIPTVVRQAVHDEAVPLAREGMQVRDWMHVDDYCRGMIAAFLRAAPGEIFNFSGHCERTDLGVARNIVELLGKPASLITGIPAKSRVNGRCAVESAKALRYFGWHPEISIKNALGNLARELASNVVAQG